MGRFVRITLPSIALAMAAISSVSHATCWESGEGVTAVYRNPSVAAEFKSAAFVITGRVLSERKISTPDDSEGYAWTIYTVEVLETFKGKPHQAIRLRSENSSGRFPMDIGESYLLFVSHSPKAEMAGQERLPDDHVDNCGNSASTKDAGPVIKTVKDLSGAR